MLFQHTTTAKYKEDDLPERLALSQKRAGRILEKARRHQLGSWWIWIIPLIEMPHSLAVGAVFRLRARDVHRCADAYQGKKTGSSFTMHADATVRARYAPDVAFMETIRWEKLDPKAHRIADRYVLPLAGLRRTAARVEAVGIRALVSNLVRYAMTAKRCLTVFTHASLDRHEAAIAFHHVDILRGGRDFHDDICRVMRL